MKINEETTISEEQVLFNKLNWENQQMILRIMRCLQPCELECEKEEEPRDIEVCGSLFTKSEYDKLVHSEEEKKIPENNFNYIYSCEDEHIMANFENIKTTLKDIIDYLKSKGDE